MMLGEAIKTARKSKGLTQRELAQMIGAKPNSISDWENNAHRPNGSTLIILFHTLDISVSDLLDGYNPNLNELEELQQKNNLDLSDKEYIALVFANESVKDLGADIREAVLNQFSGILDAHFEAAEDSPYKDKKFSDYDSIGKTFCEIYVMASRYGVELQVSDTLFKIFVSFLHLFDSIEKANKKYPTVNQKQEKLNFLKADTMRLSDFIKDDAEFFIEHCYDLMNNGMLNSRNNKF